MDFDKRTFDHAIDIVSRKNNQFHNTLMILTYLLEDYTDKEIAEELGVSQSNVRMNRKKYLKG